MNPRTRRLTIVGLVVAASLGVIGWNTAAQEGPIQLGVSEAKRSAYELGDVPVTVRGAIEAGSIVYNGTNVESFVLTDGQERLFVVFGQAPPDAFGPKDVVVDGRIVVAADGTVAFAASNVFIGCASKY